MLSTAACATAVASSACSALVPYDQAAMIQAADELQALPVGAEIRTMIADYGATRAQIRACQDVGR